MREPEDRAQACGSAHKPRPSWNCSTTVAKATRPKPRHLLEEEAEQRKLASEVPQRNGPAGALLAADGLHVGQSW